MKPIIHFAHANGLPSASYQKLLNALAPQYQIKAIPVLGHDPQYPVTNNWHHLTRELIHHIETHCSKPVVGLGHSLGGALTLIVAHQRPDLFEQVILLDVPTLTLTDSLLVQAFKGLGLMDQVTPAKKSRTRRTHWPDKESAYQYFREKRLFANFDEQCLRDYVEAGLKPVETGGYELSYQLDVELAVYRTVPHRPVFTRRSLKVPVGVLVGKETDTVRKYQYLKMKNQLGFISKRIPGSHMFPLEYPLETAHEIRHLEQRLRGRQ